MAREAFRSLYGDLTKLKDDSVLKDPAAGPDDDDELFELLLAVSDWVDHYCNRHFYPKREVMLFDGPGGDRLLVPDLIAVAELEQAESDGRGLGRAWRADEYRLLPYNAAPLQPWGHPYGALRSRADESARHGFGGGFPAGEANFRVTGLWGYRCFAEGSGATMAATLSPDATAAKLSDVGQIRVGQTLLLGMGGARGVVDAEQALVTALKDEDAILSRGLNGTSATEHESGVNVRILRWPPSVERAALIQAARIWTRAADFEPFYVDADVDTDVRLLLEPYRKQSGQ